jgi:hypothetical protein
MKKIILILITILFATNVLTAPVTITLGKLPTVKIAFGATAAIGWGYGAAGTGGHVLLVQMQQVFLALNQV